MASGQWNGSGRGFNESNNNTSYHFAYTELTGDGEMIAKVDSLENTNVDAGAAIVLRTSLDDQSGDAATVLARPTSGSQFTSRGFDAGDGNGSQTFDLSKLPGPVWLRLERRGNSVIGYVGPDGITWAPMQHIVFDDLPDTVFIGLASTSHTTSTNRATAEFSNVQISAQPDLNVVTSGSNTPPTVSSSDLAETAYLSSSATSTNEVATEHAQLFNGVIGNTDGNTGNDGEVRINQNDTITINFDTISQPEGYDITQINTYFGLEHRCGRPFEPGLWGSL